MNIRLFPSGKVHSVYLDMVKHPPIGINYIGDFSYSTGTSVDFAGKGVVASVADYFNMPYVCFVQSDCPIHSCQKLLKTNVSYVIDIEHGNPFMGPYNVFKNNYSAFKWFTKKILLQGNCRMIMPWSNIAKEAFCLNFDFLGKGFLDNRVKVVYPATFPSNEKTEKFPTFTFIFVGGKSFFAKGGLQTLAAFKTLKSFDIRADLIVVGDTPEYIRMGYADVQGLYFHSHMDREYLMSMLAQCHCLVLPSIGDTFGMIILEAKARGVPAIVVDSFSAKEIVDNNVTGLVIDPDTELTLWFDEHGRKVVNKTKLHSQFSTYIPSQAHVSRLANAMLRMINYPNFVSVMGEKARIEIETGKFSIDVRNKALRAIYEEL